MKKLLIPLIAAGSLLYIPASHAEDPCKVIMCMAGKLTGDSGGSECNSAEAAFFNIVKKNKHGFLPNHTKDARKAFLNECPDNGEGGSNQSMISQIISKYRKFAYRRTRNNLNLRSQREKNNIKCISLYSSLNWLRQPG